MAKRTAAAGIAWLAMCSSAAAHPGHGRDGGDFGVLHYLSEPAHLVVAIPMVLIAALAAGYAGGLIRPRGRRRS